MKISVIIPTYNKEPRLNLMLTSVTTQEINPNDFELLIVDDGSCDMTKECIQRYSSRIDIKYYKSKNRGRASARNIGIEHAQGEIIVFSDDDLIWSPDFLLNHLFHQKKENAIIHGKIYNLSRVKFFENPTIGTLFPSLHNSVDIAQMKKYCITQGDIVNNFQEKIVRNGTINFLERMIQRVFNFNILSLAWIGFTGGNLSCPAKWLRSVNGFDEQFGDKWGFEDFELGYRFLQKGFKFKYSDDSVNYHLSHYRKTYKQELESTFKYFYQKYNDESITDIYHFLNGECLEEELLKKYKREGEYI